MSLLQRHAFGERRPRRVFHICVEVDRVDPALLVTARPGSLDGFLLSAVCSEEGIAVATVGRLPLSRADSVSLLQATEAIAQTWGPTLGVVLNCEWRRMDWVAFDGQGQGFAATHPGGSGPWVSLQDLVGTSPDLLLQFLGVFPEMETFAKNKLWAWLPPGASDPSAAAARGAA